MFTPADALWLCVGCFWLGAAFGLWVAVKVRQRVGLIPTREEFACRRHRQ